jgi:transposase
MHLSYPDLIEESVSDLADKERAHRGTPLEIRLKMLRLLKAGTFRSRSALAPVLGYSKRQLKRWFDTYQEGGLEDLLDRGSPGGSTERVTPEAWADLEKKMIGGEVPRLEDARRYLAEEHDIQYANVTSLSSLFQRRGVKLKTGRKQNRKADPEAQAAFKKSAHSGDKGRF